MEKARYLFIVFVMLILTSCISIPKKGDSVKKDDVYLIGRLDTGIDLITFFNRKSIDDLWLTMIFQDDPDKGWMDEGRIYRGCAADDYFVVEVPRLPVYLKHIDYRPLVSVGTQTVLDLKPELKLDLQPGDQFLYVGDLSISFQDEKAILSVTDEYEEAKERFNGYFVGLDGEPIAPEKKLFSGGGEIEVSRVLVQYYLQY
jgi:hypothetical protein